MNTTAQPITRSWITPNHRFPICCSRCGRGFGFRILKIVDSAGRAQYEVAHTFPARFGMSAGYVVWFVSRSLSEAREFADREWRGLMGIRDGDRGLEGGTSLARFPSPFVAEDGSTG